MLAFLLDWLCVINGEEVEEVDSVNIDTKNEMYEL